MNTITRLGKRLLILPAFLLAATIGIGQTNTKAAEAKAAYLLAEEEFSAGKAATALAYLEEASSKLGTTNAKILYLKIMALQVLTKEDDANLPKLKAAIEAFEKAPDFESFNEEKQLEVMKLKLKLGKDGGLGRSVTALEANAYAKLGMSGWQVGVKLEDMKAGHPDFFAQAKRTDFGDTISVYQSPAKPFYGITVTREMVIYLYKVLYDSDDNSSFSAGVNVLEDLKKSFGGNPEEKVTRSVSDIKWFGYTLIQKTLTWKEKNIQVTATLTTTDSKNYKKPNTFSSNVQLGIVYLSK